MYQFHPLTKIKYNKKLLLHFNIIVNNKNTLNIYETTIKINCCHNNKIIQIKFHIKHTLQQYNIRKRKWKVYKMLTNVHHIKYGLKDILINNIFDNNNKKNLFLTKRDSTKRQDRK